MRHVLTWLVTAGHSRGTFAPIVNNALTVTPTVIDRLVKPEPQLVTAGHGRLRPASGARAPEARDGPVTAVAGCQGRSQQQGGRSRRFAPTFKLVKLGPAWTGHGGSRRGDVRPHCRQCVDLLVKPGPRYRSRRPRLSWPVTAGHGEGGVRPQSPKKL